MSPPFLCDRHAAPPFRARLCCLALSCLVLAGAARAETAAPDAPESTGCLPELLPGDPVRQLQENQIHVTADRARGGVDDVGLFSGNVQVRYAGQELRADQLRYEHATGEAQASGGVCYARDDLRITAARMQMDLGTSVGVVEDAEYLLARRNASGHSSRIEIDGPQLMRLRGASYTTCDPDDPDWQLRSSTITLDRDARQGSARNVVLDFMDVPVLYLPYIRFPITEDRMSGFLFPSLGSAEATGLDLRVPYYWNIAPHRDLTLTPRFMSDRGTMLETEFRYLNPRSAGEMDLAYLPDDDRYGDDRSGFFWRHRGRPLAGWSTNVNYNYVSDDEFFAHFGAGLAQSSITHLERRADVAYNANTWRFLARAQGFQSLVASSPYQRLPQLLLDTRLPQPDNALNYQLNSELVRFRDNGDRTEGTRLDVRPSISYPWRGLPGFLVPSLSLAYTAYQLDNTTGEEEPSRTAPIFSVDSGIFLERSVTIGDSPILQTLEPRLFYLYVPYREQADLPVFDTGRYDFSFSQLFRTDRFAGRDRLGDANQLSAALTTRLLNERTGRELLSASIGQIFYFRDRRVTLPDEPAETNDRSALAAGLVGRLAPAWRASADLLWDPEASATELGTARMRYQPEENRFVGLSYRYRRDVLENTELAFLWPLNPRWQVLGRWQYSLREELTQERILGFGYDTCCWGARLVGREYLSGTGAGELTRGIYFELELKGLSTLGDGRRIEEFLERGMLGSSLN